MSFVDVNIRSLFEAGVHYGHMTRFREPKMEPYIYGSKNKVTIINLDKTIVLFHEAMRFIHNIAAKGGKIMFVGTKYAARNIVKENAKKVDMPYVNYRWLGGMLTNYKTIKKSIRRLRDIEAMKAEGIFEKITKKEALVRSRELEKLERSLGGIKDMSGLPDAIFVLDVGCERIAVQEAKKLGIPVIGIVDSNRVPDQIDYMIPGNDDSKKAIQLYVESVTEVISKAKEKFKAPGLKAADSEEVEEINSENG